MSRKVTVQTINEMIATTIPHVCILVPGTTDPVNITPNNQNTSYAKTTGRSNSYPSASMYWDDVFYNEMLALEKQMRNFVVFDRFGWSGDNCVNNREVAGKYLINRLFMPDKHNKQGYYEDSKDKPMYFHLIGHSHGGNVINEMTQQIHKLGNKWPKKWKIKSIIYLSTPFFNNQHQIKVTPSIFHKKAEILHVYNDYDLTQNVIADFSLFDLSIIEAILKDKKVISAREKTPTHKASEKGKLIGDLGLIDTAIHAYKNIPTNKLSDLWLSKEEGEDFYTKTIDFFKALERVFLFENIETQQRYGLFEVIEVLNKKIEFSVSDFLKETIPENELNTKRQILDDESYVELKNILERILKDIGTLKEAFEEKKRKVILKTTSYSRSGILDDLSASKDLIDTLTFLLDIDKSTLVSANPTSLWNVLFTILDTNIESFDNTYVFPNKQFKGSFLESTIQAIDVTTRDEYDKKTAQSQSASRLTQSIVLSNTTPMFGIQQEMSDMLNPQVFSQRYYDLLKKIKPMEEAYESNPNQTNLMNILFTLLAHSPVHKGIDSWANLGLFGLSVVLNKEAEQSLDKFKVVITKLKTIFNKKYVGNLEAFNMGDLMYFMQESHSTSRRYLHKDIQAFIEKMVEGEK